jgi:hypothetical protein
MKRSPLSPGAKALERGSTFASRGEGLQRRTPPRAASPAKPRASFTPASPAQRAAVAGRGSIVSGETPVDAAHLTPRAWGGCDDPLCVVPLTRAEHRAFDDGRLDILPFLIAHGCWAELAHAVEAHRMDPIALLHRCTGERYVPERSVAA